MTHGVFVYFLLGVSISFTFASVLSYSDSEQVESEGLAERLLEVEKIQRVQTEQLKAQKDLIEKQTKHIQELTSELSNMKKAHNCYKADGEDPKLMESLTEDKDRSAPQGFNNRNETMMTGIRTLRGAPGMVAFTAYLGHTEELSGAQVVKFDKVITNEGGAYNQISGFFTAPIDGVYMFSFFIGQRGSNQLGIDLVRNSQRIAGAVVEGNQNYQDLQGGSRVRFTKHLTKRLIKHLALNMSVSSPRPFYGVHVHLGNNNDTAMNARHFARGLICRRKC